uniref:Putative U2 small nuclear ribonucleoprotein A n=1 Tax=Trepomonas sp. PC1 TaxID=1076344 RepID=A0A146KFZ6_9EUKA|eukprot:JAP95387.1 Putative U2 small nuclear ribonucleoprotein A' [Trepomonas sp. PC1]
MVRITLELIRKRTEHHDGPLDQLQEIALHQYKIRKIETLNQLCPRLQILLLQNNKITKIEGLQRLKSLKYLNLALNRITRLENMESLESLQKLDLTVNFIYDYRDFKCLSGLTRFEELHVLGNPCESSPYFRQYVLVQLMHLKRFNGEEVTRAERIQASQLIHQKIDEINQMKFEKQNPNWAEESENSDYTENDSNTRIKRAAEQTAHEECALKIIEKKREKGMLLNDQIMQWNDTSFRQEIELLDQTQEVLLKIYLPEHLSTEYVTVDVETDWVFVKIKEKTMQLRLPHKVKIDQARVVRVMVTGVLKVYMPVWDDDKIIVYKPIEKKLPKQEIQTIAADKEEKNDQKAEEEDLPEDLPDLV